jgi:hypothetical protein
VYKISAARATAIHECCLKAGRYSMSAYQAVQMTVYRTCMYQHSQMP